MHHRSLGLDLDDGRILGEAATHDVAVPRDLVAAVCLSEHLNIRAKPENLVFCAKEAVFKCQHGLTKLADLDFHDIAVIEDPSHAVFEARLVSRSVSHAISSVIAKIRVRPFYIQGLTGALAFLAR
jgi:4'-phosphopantetheinyl transferase EntD